MINNINASWLRGKLILPSAKENIWKVSNTLSKRSQAALAICERERGSRGDGEGERDQMAAWCLSIIQQRRNRMAPPTPLEAARLQGEEGLQSVSSLVRFVLVRSDGAAMVKEE